jgi:hypothetical protein
VWVRELPDQLCIGKQRIPFRILALEEISLTPHPTTHAVELVQRRAQIQHFTLKRHCRGIM